MLADAFEHVVQSGRLGRTVHLPGAFRLGLVDFIAGQLPDWRDDPGRASEDSETVLTSQLCAHLNSAARHSVGWDIIQFRVEEPDERRKGRKIDLVPAPCASTIWIEGIEYSHYATLLPIECKRLPTPPGRDRDEREYLYSRHGSTGGVQRFKAGHHGAAHAVGAMIAYVQQDDPVQWVDRMWDWLVNLVANNVPGWSLSDEIKPATDSGRSMLRLDSSHARTNGFDAIALAHLWVDLRGRAASLDHVDHAPAAGGGAPDS